MSLASHHIITNSSYSIGMTDDETPEDSPHPLMNPSQKPLLSPVAVWVSVCTLLSAAGWMLSAAHQLNLFGYGVVLVLSMATGAWWWWRAQPRLRLGLRPRRFRRGFPLAFALVAALALAGGLVHAPNNYDALTYRTPRVLYWLAEGRWHWIHSDVASLNTRGCGFEWVSAPLLLLTGTDRWFFLINAVSFLLLPGLCYSLLTRLGVRSRVAWHWMWVIPAGYCYLLQAGGIGNDLFGTTLALAALDFALRAARERSATAAWLAILAAGLMTASKAFNLLLLLPWGLVLLPATGILFRRPLTTLLVGALALLVSLAPTALFNARYCGDWKGLKAEPMLLGTGEPMLHLGVNSVLVTIHNFNPPFNPFSKAWNGVMLRVIPADLALKMSTQFQEDGAKLKLGEMAMEESAGLGFGVSLLVLTVVCGRIRLCRRGWREWSAALIRPPNLVAAGAWVMTLYFFTQSGLDCPARYLAPWYLLLLVPVLRLPRASQLTHRLWWRRVALLGFALAALLVIVSPARPLLPARSLLRAIHADNSSSPWLQRVWTVYSVYDERADGFAPVRATLPADLKTLGLVAPGDPETSLWRPFGSRRIVHVTGDDDVQTLRSKDIKLVLIHDNALNFHGQPQLNQWLARFDAEIVSSFELILTAHAGSTSWHLVRLRAVEPLETRRAN